MTAAPAPLAARFDAAIIALVLAGAGPCTPTIRAASLAVADLGGSSRGYAAISRASVLISSGDEDGARKAIASALASVRKSARFWAAA